MRGARVPSRLRATAIALAASLAISACGFKGPLYLPEDAPASEGKS